MGDASGSEDIGAKEPATDNPEPTPRAALGALCPQARAIRAVKLGPFTLEHWIALQRLSSPIVCGGEPTKRDVARAAGLMTISGEDLSGDDAELAEQAENSGRCVASQLFPMDFPDLVLAVNGCITDAFGKHIPVAPEDGGGREKKVPAAGSSTSSKPSGG